MGDQIFVNNRRVDGNIIVRLDGDTYEGFTEVGYGTSRKKKKGFGLSRNRGPQALSKGYRDTADMTLKGPLESVRAFFDALAARAPVVDGVREIGQVPFDVEVSYEADGRDIVDQIVGNEIIDWKSGVPAADSEDHVLEELTTMCKKVILDNNITI